MLPPLPPPPSVSCCLVLVLFVFLTFASYTGADILPTWVDCQSPAPSPIPSSGNATGHSSVFRGNVAALLDVLPSSAAATGGFASLARGDDDRAFARGLCFGQALGKCQACLINAAVNILGRCNTSRRAAMWYEDCFLSYADTNVSTAYEQSYRAKLHNRGFVSDKNAFNRTYNQLMSRLLARAVNGSSAKAVVPAFATGHAVFDQDAATTNGTMYGMVQCMRDRTAAECARCLKDSVPELPKCCYGNQGGVVLAYNCYLRVETYTYYDLSLDAPPPPVPPPLPPPPAVTRDTQGKKTAVTLAIGLPGGTVLLVVVILAIVYLLKWKARQKVTPPSEYCENEEDMGSVGLHQFNLPLLRLATDNFSEENKLGKGGFGEVFKGTLQSGEQIAVKRLSKRSSQGFPELKNEFVLAAKLKHKNLAPLVGICLQQEEKLLVYEYMPNSSLDTFLFDPVKRQLLDWGKRFTIIRGIARGLRYLHEESHLKVIHRDLKPSNVLLDADMNPKISDFGLARAFEDDQSQAVTKRPAGTLGYMSPEYAYCGHVSTKSDMFSFGVMVLEMVTGRKNSTCDHNLVTPSLLSYVWRKWSAGSVADVVDPLLGWQGQQYPEDEVLSCVEVGLLCVQENPVDRPDASAVVLLLGSPKSMSHEAGRREPSRPAFFFDAAAGGGSTNYAGIRARHLQLAPSSENLMTISEFQPR